MTMWPEDKPDHDPDKTYDEREDEWSNDATVLVKTAARYKSFVVACSRGEIYYGEI